MGVDTTTPENSGGRPRSGTAAGRTAKLTPRPGPVHEPDTAPGIRNGSGSGVTRHTCRPSGGTDLRRCAPVVGGAHRLPDGTGDNAPVTRPDQLRLLAVHAHPDDESSKGAAT